MENSDELVSKVPEAIRKNIDPNYLDDEIMVKVSDDEDELEEDQPKEDITESFEWEK